MVSKKGRGDVLSLTSLLFVVFALTLTTFSIFYVYEWQSSRITGFNVGGSCLTNGDCDFSSGEVCWQTKCSQGYGICESNFDCDVGQICVYEQCIIYQSGGSTGGSTTTNSPPQAVIEEISGITEQVTQGASYASSINSIIEQNPVSEQQLINYGQNLQEVLSDVLVIYARVSEVADEYPSSRIDESYRSVVEAINVIEDINENVQIILSGQVEERQENQREQAEWVVSTERIIERSIPNLEEYVEEIIPSENLVSETLVSDPVEPVRTKVTDCKYPVYLTAFDERLVNFGSSGVDSVTGSLCSVESQDVYDAATSSPNMRNFVIPNLAVPLDVESLIESRSLVALHFEQRGESGHNRNVGVVIQNKDGFWNIHFLSSPSYYGLEKKIAELVNNLLFGGSDVDVSSLNGMSVREMESIVGENKSVPWVLWIVLSVMIVSFLFFGKFLVSDYRRMILSGKKYLNDGNYNRAVKIYNELTELDYSGDKIMKQEILNYLIVLKKKTGEDQINLNLPKGFSLPRIDSISSVHGLTNESSRVEKMIIDTLRDVNDSPKVAIVRLPVIVEAYKNLDFKSRDKLAPLYESLVYKMRDLKR